jgi:serpin B
MSKNLLQIGVIFLVLIAGCVSDGKVPDTEDDIVGIEANDDIVIASNQFAFEFYSNLKDVEEGNIFFSPYSISTALAMTYEGARGQTAREIQSVFHFPESESARRTSFLAIHNQLNRPSAEYKLHTANALWIEKDYQLLEEYTGAIESYYGGKATNLDFVSQAENARLTINSWVEEKTNDKIKELFKPGSINQLTRLVITNAIYFKGTWAKQFDEEETKEEDFRITPDSAIKVPMMRLAGEDARFNYTENENLQVLEMIYEGGDLSMLVLLPKDDDIKALEDSLTLENLQLWRDELAGQRVDVYMPKFTFTREYSLNDDLRKMGMPLAFEADKADFSGIDGTKELFIHTIVHKAFVEVNEEGTEAAAATGVVVGITSMPPPPPVFRADHPFIFMIQQRETGNILFLGRVSNPTS